MATDVRVIANLDIRTCVEGQRSCLLECQSRNEADLRFQGVYITYCNDY